MRDQIECIRLCPADRCNDLDSAESSSHSIPSEAITDSIPRVACLAFAMLVEPLVIISLSLGSV